MGLPEININFQSLAISAIQRSQQGIVALVLADDTASFESIEYRSIADVESSDWAASNLEYIKQTFLGVPSKVIVERVSEAIEDDPVNYSEAQRRLANKRWNYLAIPGITSSAVSDISSWIIGQRTNEKKTFKAVLPHSESDNEGIINFTTEDIKVGESTYSASEYTARIAGILAGLSLERSATYYVLPEVESIIEHEDPNKEIDEGQLILINDGEKIKIGRAVNSLTTTSTSKGEDWKKIKIIEGHDMIQDDIRRTFEDQYVGKVNNSYDNQVLFLAAVNAYLSSLEGSVLNPNVENAVEVDVEAQRKAWESIGTDTSDWDDQEVKNHAFQSKVFAGGSIRFLDAMEDLEFVISV